MDLEDLFRRPSALARFRLPPLGPMMDGFCEWLRCRGCSQHGIRRRLRQVSLFNRYLRRRAIKNCQEVETSQAERFINEHLPRCRCPSRYKRRNAGAAQSSLFATSWTICRSAVFFPPLHHLARKAKDFFKSIWTI